MDYFQSQDVAREEDRASGVPLPYTPTRNTGHFVDSRHLRSRGDWGMQGLATVGPPASRRFRSAVAGVDRVG